MVLKQVINKIIALLITFLVAFGIISQPGNLPSSRLKETDSPVVPTRTAISTRTPAIERQTGKTPEATLVIPTPTRDPLVSRPEPGSVCGFDPGVENIITGLDPADWVNWIEFLSGEKPVTMNGETFTIQTRFTESMFSGDPDARAYDFVIGQLRAWGYQDEVDLFEHTYKPFTGSPSSTWKNIIVVIPGSDPDLSHEQVLMTAHLDSISQGDPEERAPGADDNGSGVATLMEAARVFKGLSFKRTVKIIFFTGEETGLHGSRAYVLDFDQEMKDILGVFNLDMFGYDGDGDRCFEIHAGWTQASNIVAGCLADTIEIYDPELNFDYLVDKARGSSDHTSFWNAGVGAIEILENFDTHEYAGGCGESDINPNYHTDDDLISAMNIDTGHAIARAAIAAAARLAEPLGQ